MKRILAGSCVFLLFTLSSFSQASNTWSVKFADAIKSRYSPTINAMTGKGWEYSNTIILHGMEKVYNQVPDPAYLNYIQAYVDAYINASGAFSPAITVNTLDKIHPGITCLFLWEKTGLLKYKTIATTLRNILVGLPPPPSGYGRTPNGIYWHKDNGTTYDNVVMLDGIYMAHPFLAKYGRLFGDNAAIDTAVNQTLFVYNQLYDNTTHLIRHAWTSDPVSYSWDGASGNSNAVWSRAMGWYVMALVDILKYVPAAHPKRAQLLAALSNLAIGIKNYQDAGTGLWYQVVNKTSATLAGNYLETSGSAMFVYALKTASDSGWINPATYLPVAQDGWAGLQTKISNYSDGKPMINDFAPAMSVQNTEALYVQASYQPVDCPVSPGTLHPHGYAAILMAASAMEFSFVILPVRFISFTAKESSGKIRLSWQNADETEVDYYQVQRSINGSDFSTIGTARPAGLASYTFDDNAINSKTVYYRINSVSFNGSAHYSDILPIRHSNGNPEMKISPNPVQDGLVNISLINIERGRYMIKLINSAGNIIATKAIEVNEEEALDKTVTIPAGAGKGVYHVQLEGNDFKINKSILIK